MVTRKYRNVPVVVDGIRFASKREAARYGELKLLERAGEVTDLTLQTPFVLAPAVKLQGRRRPALVFLADFVYRRGGQLVVEDCKGFRTEVYRVKRHLMATVHGIEILET